MYIFFGGMWQHSFADFMTASEERRATGISLHIMEDAEYHVYPKEIDSAIPPGTQTTALLPVSEADRYLFIGNCNHLTSLSLSRRHAAFHQQPKQLLSLPSHSHLPRSTTKTKNHGRVYMHVAEQSQKGWLYWYLRSATVTNELGLE